MTKISLSLSRYLLENLKDGAHIFKEMMSESITEILNIFNGKLGQKRSVNEHVVLLIDGVRFHNL